ncbi:MAG: hypothetical protein WCW87_01860 [Candidatus Paceibacterota bacterium]
METKQKKLKYKNPESEARHQEEKRILVILNRIGPIILSSGDQKGKDFINRVREIISSGDFKNYHEELFLLIFKLQNKGAYWIKSYSVFVYGNRRINLDLCYREPQKEKAQSYVRILKAWLKDENQKTVKPSAKRKKLYAAAA